MRNIIYHAVSKITDERERNGSYKGNGHHLAQEITEAVVKAFVAEFDVKKNEKQNISRPSRKTQKV